MAMLLHACAPTLVRGNDAGPFEFRQGSRSRSMMTVPSAGGMAVLLLPEFIIPLANDLALLLAPVTAHPCDQNSALC